MVLKLYSHFPVEQAIVINIVDCKLAENKIEKEAEHSIKNDTLNNQDPEFSNLRKLYT